jgi:hypothetical protein
MNRWFTGLGELGRSMFVLTPGERKALCLVLALALLGLTVKAWHARSAGVRGDLPPASLEKTEH